MWQLAGHLGGYLAEAARPENAWRGFQRALPAMAEVGVEYVAGEAGRHAGNLALSAVRGAPGWIPGLTTAFAKGVSWRTRDLVRKYGRRAYGMSMDYGRKPYVPQKRYPRQYVRQSFGGDRFRSGSRAIFWERPGDWKKQFRGVGKY